MNSSEHIDHNAETNNQLLFPSIFKQAWSVFKRKWCALYTLSLIPIIFVVASYTIFISIVYVVLKLAGDQNVLFSISSIFHYAPHYVSVASFIVGAITILGVIYFSLRSSIAAIKVLESESKMSIRNAWHGIPFKRVFSLFGVAVILGIILAGGYILLFIPLLFLATFYVNAVFVNIVEGKKGIDALVLSRQYVRGYGTIVFVNLLVVVAVGLLFGLLFRLSLGASGLLLLAVYFGKISILTAIVLAIAVVILATLVMVLWKSFSLVVLYSMFKKLQAIKSHHTVNLAEGRKTVKVWLLISIIVASIFIGGMAALKHDVRQQGPVSLEEARMMYTNDSNFTDFNDNYGVDTSYLEGPDGQY